ncbi:MAG: GNAT family N-acyltransferase [Pseudomonadota bacterium]
MAITLDPDKIEIRLAQNNEEIEASQRLRYAVFYEEYGAKPTPEMAEVKRDMDKYDPVTDHLIVMDHGIADGIDSIVGTYRLFRQSEAEKFGQFYTSDEYNIKPLIETGNVLLELGRSCVLPDYRTRPILQKMWQGIAHYVADHNIGLMFGCASLHGTNPSELAEQLSYLYHYHLAEPAMCPRALDNLYTKMDLIPKDELEVKKAFMALPPLIKGYIRLGASIGDGAVIDKQFNTTDVCIVMPTAQVTEKYLKHYERVTQKTMPTQQGQQASS